MNAKKRYLIARYILSYLISQNMDRVQISARDIVNFHHLPKMSSHSISAFLNTLYLNATSENYFGFEVIGRQDLKKSGDPYRFTIKKQRMVKKSFFTQN
jgi:hypothetical protein